MSTEHSPVAQSVEQLTVNQLVVGSSPTGGAAPLLLISFATGAGARMAKAYHALCTGIQSASYLYLIFVQLPDDLYSGGLRGVIYDAGELLEAGVTKMLARVV